MCTCERVGGRREADAGVAYHGLSQFKFKITGLKFVTVEKPNWPLTTWTLTGNLRREASSHSPRGMYKMVWKNIWKSLKLDRSWLLKSESRNGWRKGAAAEQAGASLGSVETGGGSGADRLVSLLLLSVCWILLLLFLLFICLFALFSLRLQSRFLWICCGKRQTKIHLAAPWLSHPNQVNELQEAPQRKAKTT